MEVLFGQGVAFGAPSRFTQKGDRSNRDDGALKVRAGRLPRQEANEWQPGVRGKV